MQDRAEEVAERRNPLCIRKTGRAGPHPHNRHFPSHMAEFLLEGISPPYRQFQLLGIPRQMSFVNTKPIHILSSSSSDVDCLQQHLQVAPT